MKRITAFVAALMLAGAAFAIPPTPAGSIDNSGQGNVADGNVTGNGSTSTSTNASTTTVTGNNGTASGAGSIGVLSGAGGAGGGSPGILGGAGGKGGKGGAGGAGGAGGNATGGQGGSSFATGGRSVSNSQGGKSVATASNNVDSSGNGAGQSVNIKSPRLAATAIAGYGETTAGCRYHDGGGLQLLIAGASFGRSFKDFDCARLELVKYFCANNAPEAAQDVACKISFVKEALGDDCHVELISMCVIPEVEVVVAPTADYVTHAELIEVEHRSLEKKLSK